MDADVGLGALDGPMAGALRGRHILSIKQFARDDLAAVIRVAHQMRVMVGLVGSVDLLKGRLLANLFYEPSTRTSSSFNAAMKRLGGDVVAINEVRYSSVAKGETLEDTIRTLESYVDLIVLRHHQIGAAAAAARVARKPIVNAGDGAGEHPTQALLDLFTIVEELGHVEGLRVTMVGDLRFGRTVHSLSRLLALYGVELRLVSPPALRMPEPVRAELRGAGLGYSEHEALDEVLETTDVLYVTRVQKERFDDPAEYDRLANAYVIGPEVMARAPERMILMHPFPRVGEIPATVDADPRAAYFRQIEYGLYVRMALLAMVLGRA
ncbi:MAG TPA: aspartate carbamoyltransferase [Myxococcota bacterium]|nr:aspartate carbamoyltransferase [Myxococcota bacterium]